jgi:hypothetical protein
MTLPQAYNFKQEVRRRIRKAYFPIELISSHTDHMLLILYSGNVT